MQTAYFDTLHKSLHACAFRTLNLYTNTHCVHHRSSQYIQTVHTTVCVCAMSQSNIVFCKSDAHFYVDMVQCVRAARDQPLPSTSLEQHGQRARMVVCTDGQPKCMCGCNNALQSACVTELNTLRDSIGQIVSLSIKS